MSCKEKFMSFWWLNNSSKCDLTVQCLLYVICLNERRKKKMRIGGKKVDGAFPEESLQSVSLGDTRQSTFESALRNSAGLDFYAAF